MKNTLLIFAFLLFISAFSQDSKRIDLYIIQKGDTYFSIAKKHQMTVDNLLKINALDYKNPLLYGVSLFVKKNTLQRTKYHIVKKGETLYSIAKKYRIDLNTLKAKNNLRNNTIRLGQRLKINK